MGRNRRLNSKRRRKVLRQLCEEQDFRCAYCEFEIVVNASGQTEQFQNTATIDHKVPQNDGGENARNNLVAACMLCNRLKDCNDYHWYLEALAKLLANELVRTYWHQFSKHELQILLWEVGAARAIDSAAESKGHAWEAVKLLQRMQQKIK